MTIKIPKKHIIKSLGEDVPESSEMIEFAEWVKNSHISFSEEAPVNSYFDVIDSTYLKVLDSNNKIRFLRKNRWLSHIPILVWEGIADKINNVK